jgi:hypothetical protein
MPGRAPTARFIIGRMFTAWTAQAAGINFRDINSITITATAAFSDDIRGQSRGRGDVLRATFSRANAESIVWDHIILGNLPQIADKFWQHPRLITDDSK